MEGEPSLVLVAAAKIALEGVVVERLAVEWISLDRVSVERVPDGRVLVERIASCHPIDGEHLKDSACHL